MAVDMAPVVDSIMDMVTDMDMDVMEAVVTMAAMEDMGYVYVVTLFCKF